MQLTEMHFPTAWRDARLDSPPSPTYPKEL